MKRRQIPGDLGRRAVPVLVALCVLASLAAACRPRGGGGQPGPTPSDDGHVAAAFPGFASPPTSARAINRGGFTGDATGAATLLDALSAGGFGGAEMAAAPSAAGQASLTSVLAKATQLGMRISINACGATSCGSSAVTLADSMKQLIPFDETVTTSAPGQVHRAAPPAPTGVAGSPTLVAVTAAKVASMSGSQTLLDPDTAVDLAGDVSGGQLTWTVPTPGTWKVFAFYSRATGQVPGFPPFQDPPAYTAKDPAGGAGRYLADIFDSSGVRKTLDAMGGAQLGNGNEATMGALGGDVFHDSLEVQAEMFWTADLPEQFRSRRGYSMIKYLPVLHNWKESSFNPLPVGNFAPLPAPAFDFTGTTGSRARHDYARTLSDLYVERYVRGMNDWAHEHGLRSRQEIAYNYTQLDMIRAAAAVDIPETESFDFGWGKAYDNTLPTYPSDRWRYFVDSHRLAGSGAHLSGAPRVTMEWGDDFAIWRKGPKELADLMNAAMAGGVTLPSFAGFGGNRSAVWPTPAGLSSIGFGDTVTSNYPQWRDFNPLMTYLARSTVLVESGAPRVDVTVYRDRGISSLHDGNIPLWKGTALAQRGYTYDFVDPVHLTDAAASAVPGTLFGNGAGYRALIIDQQESLPADTSAAIRRSATSGLPVVIVGTPPERASGLRDAAAGDSAVIADVAALRSLPNVRVVPTEDDVPRALADLRVDPGARFTGSGGDLQTVHRRTTTDDAWWIYNPTDKDITTTGSFVATGQPYVLDLWNGTSQKPALFATGAGRTSLPVTIPAHGTIGVTVDRNARVGAHATTVDGAEVRYADNGQLTVTSSTGGPRSVALSTDRTVTATVPDPGQPLLLSAWQLDVDEISPSGRTAHHLSLPSLQDWRSIPELTDAVGTGTYTATVAVPDAWLGAGREVELDLGAFTGAVSVSVNSHLAGVRTTPGGTRSATALLHGGSNTIAVRLDTTLLNRAAQLRAAGKPAYQTGPNPSLGQTVATPVEPEPSGLLGPVRLIPKASVTVDPNPPGRS